MTRSRKGFFSTNFLEWFKLNTTELKGFRDITFKFLQHYFIFQTVPFHRKYTRREIIAHYIKHIRYEIERNLRIQAGKKMTLISLFSFIVESAKKGHNSLHIGY